MSAKNRAVKMTRLIRFSPNQIVYIHLEIVGKTPQTADIGFLFPEHPRTYRVLLDAYFCSKLHLIYPLISHQFRYPFRYLYIHPCPSPIAIIT